MAKRKTQPTGESVHEFLASVENPRRRKDAFTLLDVMGKITKLEPEMWGPSIVGFGRSHYDYANGAEAELFLVGFSPRKQSMTLYVSSGYPEFPSLLKQLGKCRKSPACLYINKLDDVDLPTLRTLIRKSFAYAKKTEAARS